MKYAFSFLVVLAINTIAFCQTKTPPGLALIKTAELKSDLYNLADSRFKGRSAGTINELNASAWLVEQFRNIGLKPAGENGSYLQFFTMLRTELMPSSSIEINGTLLPLWKEVIVTQMVNSNLNDSIYYLGNAGDMDTSKMDVSGKVVAFTMTDKNMNLNVSLPTIRYPGYNYARFGAPLARRGAKAIIMIADERATKGWEDANANSRIGRYELEGFPTNTISTPVVMIKAINATAILNSKGYIKAHLLTYKYPYPSVNIVGKIEGTDPVLKKEYLLYSGHQDALGIRNPIKGDSIYHGADDNASVDVAIMASARAMVKYPPKRSVLVVFHGAEERGLFGSRYFSANPTVPLANIVAVLNGDMIGRNHIDSATILGMLPPHRTSKDLVQMALSANNEGPKFKLDTLWDKTNHVEGWFFRSDHLPYARLGIPSLMYTTLLHPDYHTPQDNAENIDYKKLTKMAEWMYRTGWKVANAPAKPARDLDFKLER